MNPLISCVMPTFNRSKYVPTAIRSYLQQTYPNVELVIVDDGTQRLDIPADHGITHIKLDKRTSTGEKRNIGARAAKGEIIASWDDDDWSHPHRLEDQFQRLFKTGQAVTGYNISVMYDTATKKFHRTRGGPPYFASGSSQFYLKSWWEKRPFPDETFGEDMVFARAARQNDQLSIADPGQMLVVLRHDDNTSSMNINRFPVYEAENISPEFFRAINSNPFMDLKYIYRPHECDESCLSEVRRQFDVPVLQYKMEE